MPYVGPALAVTGLLLLGVVAAFSVTFTTNKMPQNVPAMYLLKAQLLSRSYFRSSCLFTASRPQPTFIRGCRQRWPPSPRCMMAAGQAMAEKQEMSVEERQALTPRSMSNSPQLHAVERQQMFLSLNANPVELSALITALVATLFVIGFRLPDRTPARTAAESGFAG